jgi:hypothetical protein
VTSLAHRAHPASHHHPVRTSPRRRPPVERARVKPWRRPRSPEGTVSSGSASMSTGDEHVSGYTAYALRHNGQSWTGRRAPTIAGHYSNAGWLSSGMRFEYRPVTAPSDPKNRRRSSRRGRDRSARPGRRPP